jgi:hypothetical protein
MSNREHGPDRRVAADRLTDPRHAEIGPEKDTLPPQVEPVHTERVSADGADVHWSVSVVAPSAPRGQSPDRGRRRLIQLDQPRPHPTDEFLVRGGLDDRVELTPTVADEARPADDGSA